MKKLTYILLFLCFACNSSDDADTSTFEVSVTQSTTSLVVDQILTLTATANEKINQISFSKDGGETFDSEFSSSTFDTTVNLYLDFDTLGPKTIIYRVKNNAGDVVDNIVSVTVERGNAVQLLSVKLNSFFDMGNTWDSEYATTDPNHLADVFFGVLKPRLNFLDGTRSRVPSSSWLWYRSQTRENENDLSWNLQNEELFINVSELTAYIAFADDDGGNIAQDIMLGPPFQSLIPLSNYINSKPGTITVKETHINLEYVIGLDW
jgi:hypothetical protein